MYIYEKKNDKILVHELLVDEDKEREFKIAKLAEMDHLIYTPSVPSKEFVDSLIYKIPNRKVIISNYGRIPISRQLKFTPKEETKEDQHLIDSYTSSVKSHWHFVPMQILKSEMPSDFILIPTNDKQNVVINVPKALFNLELFFRNKEYALSILTKEELQEILPLFEIIKDVGEFDYNDYLYLNSLYVINKNSNAEFDNKLMQSSRILSLKKEHDS
jgi:hypothetical protein